MSYIKRNWAEGEPITADKLNNMEDGILEAKKAAEKADVVIGHAFPLGSIYLSTNTASPAAFIGGTWERIKDTFLLAAGDTYAAGSAGGEATHTLAKKELPRHTHLIKAYSRGTLAYFKAGDFTSGSTDAIQISGEYVNPNSSVSWDPENNYAYGQLLATDQEGQTRNQPHNNMPPYLAVYVWKRIA